MTQNIMISSFQEEDRVDYLVAVASIVSADGQVDSSEIFALRELSLLFGLGPKSRSRVLAACEWPPDDLPQILARLSGSSLRFGLLADLCFFAYADGHLASGEETHVRDFAKRLGVDAGHTDALLKFARLTRLATTAEDEEYARSLARSGRETLEAAGVPLAAVAASGTVMGMKNAGMACASAW